MIHALLAENTQYFACEMGDMENTEYNVNQRPQHDRNEEPISYYKLQAEPKKFTSKNKLRDTHDAVAFTSIQSARTTNLSSKLASNSNIEIVHDTSFESIPSTTEQDPSTLISEHIAEDCRKQLTTSEGEMYYAKNFGPLCRACANTCDRFYPINSIICNSSKTMKDMMIVLVPQMETALNDNDVLCYTCRKILAHCARFIDRCLRVEAGRRDDLICQKRSGDISPITHVIDDDIMESKEMPRVSLSCDEDVDVGNLSVDDQQDTNDGTPNEDFISDVVDAQLTNMKRRQIGLVEAVPACIPKHNLLISAMQFPTQELLKFISILPSNEVETLNLSENLENSAGKKRIILLGSTFKCKECGDYFLTEKRYQSHMRIHEASEHTQEKREELKKPRIKRIKPPVQPRKRLPRRVHLQCKICSESFSSRHDFYLHLIIHPPFICEKCGKGFPTKSQHTVHQSVHDDPMSYICEVCGKAYKCRSHLNQHKKVHEDIAHLCCKCPKTFKTLRRLKIHLKFTHGEGLTQTWTCDRCGKIFVTKSSFQLHYSQVHLRDGPLKCDICGQGFARHDYFKRHKRQHMLNDIKNEESILNGGKVVKRRRRRTRSPGPYQCQICKKVFKILGNLRLHIRTHATLSRFRCKYCTMTFKTLQRKNGHEKLHEEREFLVEYRCGICWKRMGSQEELDQHSLSHNNFKYKCNTCEESFARKHLLEHHVVNTHATNGEAEEEMRMLLSAGLGTLYK